MEQYFIHPAEEQGHLARDITRSLAVDRMLAAQDEEGLTLAEAAAVGGPALRACAKLGIELPASNSSTSCLHGATC
jgi:hypothetical protein